MLKRRFGVAGFPLAFSSSPLRKERTNIFRWLSELGLDALELQMTYGPRMSHSTCLEYNQLADDFGIKLTVHASYFIVLTSSDKEKIQNSSETLKRTYELADLLSADVVVLHPGPIYGGFAQAALNRFVDGAGETLH